MSSLKIGKNPTKTNSIEGVTNDYAELSNSGDCLWTVVEAAQFLNLEPGSLYHMISQQRIPVIRISARCVRFSRLALLTWLEQLTSAPASNKKSST